MITIPPETKKETRHLKCELTQAEKLAKAEELASVLQQLDRLEDEKKAAAEQMKHKIDEATARKSGLASVVAAGYEYRPVDCEIAKDWERKRVTTTRMDTREVIEDRAMYESELQRTLPLEPTSESPSSN